ncbi:nucleotide-binding universal stress UspA family protein [Microbacterium proteolyticum]|uniref:Nucleotide-binding universal stress UspA family protein n=1 Tax=Microbacterium proteolyticum TaxID=1572644 RepID=A0A7W5CJ98_9MICO|nr:universal stress protein [Microbacterium proteolyticum]MBB3158324.1 nucleotide-binding universal stress UspA family protein [Microbacterium proteolyticum]
MMDRVVIGVDGSAGSTAAAEWIANRLGDRPTRIDLVSVHSWASHVMADRAVQTDLEHMERMLSAWSDAYSVSTHCASGRTVNVLTELARGADLLVIGVNPQRPLTAALRGWLPVRVCAASSVPVCVIPVGWGPSDDPITVGVDSDESSSAAVRWAVREAETTTRRLRLLHAWRLPEPYDAGAVALLVRPAEVIAEHRTVLEAVRHGVAKEHPRVRIETYLARATAPAALLSYAPSSSLIVLGSHRLGILRGGLLGATAADLFWRARCPIAVIPPDASISDS